jgi:hypothetical protein
MIVGVAIKLLLRLIVGLIGKKVSLAIAVMLLGIQAARAKSVGGSLRRAWASLRSTPVKRPGAEAEDVT